MNNYSFSRGFSIRIISNVIAVVIVLLVGILMLWTSIENYYKTTAYPETPARIESITKTKQGKHTNYSVTVSYEVEGVRYREYLNDYQRGFREGNTITISYNPDNPKDIAYRNTNDQVVYSVFGGIFVLIGLFMIGYMVSSKRRKKRSRSK